MNKDHEATYILHTHTFISDFKVRHLFQMYYCRKILASMQVNKDVRKIITLFHHTVEWTSSGWVSLPEA
jgi:hypothetical protein